MCQPASPRTAVIGHRGARARRPENTLPAFEYAIAAGVDAIELDMAVTRDNVIVVSHDPILSSGAIIRHLALAEIRSQTCAPTLDEVFELAPRCSCTFNIEIKSFPDHPEYAPPPVDFSRLVLERVWAHRLEKRVIVMSFDFRTLAAMRVLAPEIRLAALIENDEREFSAVSAAAAQAEVVAAHIPLVTPSKVAAAHRARIQVISWTANTPSDWELLVAAKVDGIITDDPAALISHLRHVGNRS